MKRTLFILSFFCVSVIIAAQNPLYFNFVHSSTESGLISNQINTVVQDEQGFIWMGTTDGLQRFDGIRYKSFRYIQNDSTSIPSNPVSQLLIDKSNRLWVLLNDGNVGIFNTKTFRFHGVAVKAKDPNSAHATIKRLITDEYGNIFLLYGGVEVITWNEKKREFSYTHNFFQQKKEWAIADFAQEPGTGKYWICLQSGGLAVYDKTTGQLSYPGHNIAKEPLVEQFDTAKVFFHLFFDKQKRLWSVAWTSIPTIQCYDPKTGEHLVDAELASYLRIYHEIQGFIQQKDGSIWVKGVLVFARYNESSKKFDVVYNGYQHERSIAYEKVNSLYEDRENNIWVATDNNGLFRFNPSMDYFKNIRHENRATGKPGEGSPMSILPTKWGTTLVGTWGDGFFQYDKNFNTIPTDIKGIDNKGGPSVWCMTASRDSNTIWMAAQPGIYKIDQDHRTAQFYNPPILENRTVRQIAEDKKGNLWIGMQHTGVYKWTAAKGKNKFEEGITKITGLPEGVVGNIVIDARGYVWLTVGTGGLYVIDPDTDKIILHFHKEGKGAYRLPDAAVSSVLEYNDSLMVITTGTKIIVYNRALKWSRLIGAPEALSGYIAATKKDREGYVWLTTTNGLYRINIRNGVIMYFNRDDGIQNEHFILAASAVLPDGRMVFGTNNNIVVFDPAAIRFKFAEPDIKITDFRVMNKSLQVDSLLSLGQTELSYKNNSLVIEFSPLQYNGAFLIAYKLDGLEKDWRLADKNNQAIYSYLPPGTYTFLVKTINENREEGKEVRMIQIKINPPFWKTWWFYSLLLLAIVALLFWFDRERMKRKKAIGETRSNIAGNLHQEVSAALNNINILSEMARIKADKEPEKSKEFIEQIQSRSHNMIIAVDDMLWSIDPANDNMAKTVLRMREYIDALNNREDSGIEMLVDKNVEALKLDMQLRHEAFLLFKESISGLVKAGAKNCRIHVGLDKGTLLYTVQFSTDSCDMQQLNNLMHSQGMGKRIDTIKASLTVEMHKSNSLLLLKIPLR